MELNADFSRRIAVHAAQMDWMSSPMAGVDRRMLDRIGDEVARATSNPGIAFEDDVSGYPSEGDLFESPVRSGSFTAEKVILGRRSAVSMDASTAISAATSR